MLPRASAARSRWSMTNSDQPNGDPLQGALEIYRSADLECIAASVEGATEELNLRDERVADAIQFNRLLCRWSRALTEQGIWIPGERSAPGVAVVAWVDQVYREADAIGYCSALHDACETEDGALLVMTDLSAVLRGQLVRDHISARLVADLGLHDRHVQLRLVRQIRKIHGQYLPASLRKLSVAQMARGWRTLLEVIVGTEGCLRGMMTPPISSLGDESMDL
jgi:hypothetical protein